MTVLSEFPVLLRYSFRGNKEDSFCSDMVGEVGFEPTRAVADGFTDRSF